MKGLQKFAALCTSVVLGVCGMGSVLAQPLTADAATESTVPEGFVYVDGTHFMCDGEPFYFAGCNSYDMFTLDDEFHQYIVRNSPNPYMWMSMICLHWVMVRATIRPRQLKRSL